MSDSKCLHRRVYTAAMLLLAAVTATACGAQSGSPTMPREPGPVPEQKAATPSPAQVDSGQEGVTMKAIWVTEAHLSQMPQRLLKAYPADRHVLIHLTLDTHSVDLGAYDLASLSTLGGRGSAPLPATAWLGLEESSHHRDGVLVFSGLSNTEREGIAVLRMKDVAGVTERNIQWEF
jgi:hypothetical protein